MREGGLLLTRKRIKEITKHIEQIKKEMISYEQELNDLRSEVQSTFESAVQVVFSLEDVIEHLREIGA